MVVTKQFEIVYPIYDAARSLTFSPDGKQIASGYQYGSVRLWDVDKTLAVKKENTAEPAQTIRIGDVALVSLAWSPDGKRLAVGTADYRITLLDLINRKVLHSFVGHDGEVTALARLCFPSLQLVSYRRPTSGRCRIGIPMRFVCRQVRR